jgi:hypothetical protein
MNQSLKIGLLLGAIGIVAAGLFLAGADVTNSDQPDEEAPGAYLHVELVNNSEVLDGPEIEYADLMPDQQAFFEQAVSDDRFGTPIPDDADADADHSVWYDIDAVKYQNRTYRVFVSET